MTALDQQTFVVAGPGDGAHRTATRPSSRRTCTSPTATRSTGCTAKYRIFTYTFELYPTEKPTVWGDHYPDDSKIADADGAQPARRSCSHRPRRPARTRRSAPAPRSRTAGRCTTTSRSTAAGRATPKDKDTASSGPVAVTNPAADELARPEAAGRRGLGVGRARHGGGERAGRPDRTTSTAASPRSAAARSRSPPIPRTSAG